MPVFDYRCTRCGNRFTLLLGVVAEPQQERCPACESADISRLISRFARLRSEDEIIDAIADPSGVGDLEDPRGLADWMKRMGREMGEDLGGDVDEMLEEIENADEADTALDSV